MKILSNSKIEDIKNLAIEEYKNSQENINRRIEDRHYCDIIFDFANPFISVLCIERECQQTNEEKTVISFIENLPNQKPTIISWNLHCSPTQHNKLVEQYNRHIESRNPSKAPLKKK